MPRWHLYPAGGMASEKIKAVNRDVSVERSSRRWLCFVSRFIPPRCDQQLARRVDVAGSFGHLDAGLKGFPSVE